jgi:Cof subfamily protein (haloacid dehalogenase superfamily)
MFRLVATDLDGTLLHSDGTVTPYTRRVLDELDRRGIHVVFVTGRPIRWMDSLWDAVGGHGLAICSNGGIVYDVASHSVRNALTIDPDTLVEVGRVLRKAIPGTAFAVEKTGGFGVEEMFMSRHDRVRGVPQGPLEQIVDETVVKLLAQHEELAPAPFWEAVEELVGHLVTTTWSSTFSMVEMSARGVTKASTLERLAEELGVDSYEVVAFGDMPNDIAMLTWAGSSYAMANAHESVLGVAAHQAPGNDEDGVAVTLARLFDLGTDLDFGT